MEASNCSIPHVKNKKKVIPGWNNEVALQKAKAIFWHNIWKENGSLNDGVLADIRKSTRAKYHYAIRSARKNKEKHVSNKIADSLLNKTSADFWSEIKQINNKKPGLPNMVDNCVGQADIAGVFKNKYEQLYNSVSYDKVNMCCLKTRIDTLIKDECCKDNCHKHSINVNDVTRTLMFLKRNKNDGNLGHNTNHIIHGTQKLFVYISVLFNSMVKHGYCPEGFQLCTIVPIPKNSSNSLNDSNNYRAIAISSVLGKLFDHILLKCYSEVFQTSYNQFGFKSGMSTSMCSFTVNEIIQYYTKQGGTIYVTMLDASKAFDRVSYTTLFELLLKRGLCPLIARLLLFMYLNQQLRVRWGAHTTGSFHVSNGVKQGGVLSPILFSIYMDELIDRLKLAGIGCYVGKVFAGITGYADDINLLAPTKSSLSRMLGITTQFGIDYEVKFNPDKSKLVIFEGNNQVSGSVMFDGTVIKSSPNPYEINLGNQLGPNICKEFLLKRIFDFVRRVNVLCAKFKFIPTDARYLLFKSFCMSLYGCQLWDLESRFIELFYVAWRKCIRRVLSIHSMTHCALLPHICCDLPIHAQLINRFRKFQRSVFTSDNILVRYCGNLAKNGSRSSFCNNLNVLNLYNSSAPNYDTREQQVAAVIRDFISMRDRPFDIENIQTIIDYLCTS